MNERTENKKSLENPRRNVGKGFIGSLGVSLLVDRAYENGKSTDRIDRKMSAKLHSAYESHPIAADDFYVKQYDEKYHEARLWHGTGRYQYDESGELVDVLTSICKQSSLAPTLDEFDFMNGAMVSTSLARSRMYARAYADIHGDGAQEQNRYGSSGFWGTYVASRLPIDAAIESKVWRKEARKDIGKKIGKGDRRPWGAKAHTGYVKDESGQAEYKGIFTPFYTGSDIEGNYPILFGIKTPPVEAPIAKSIARHEVRTQDRISLEGISHIEVPYDRISETEALIKNYGLDLPVVAIETGEEYCAHQPFSSLVYPAS